jgi:hypothetical protein
MMGVIANPAEEDIVREFFELFKIPWEFYREGVRYDVVLCTDVSAIEGARAKLVLVYAGGKAAFDTVRNVQVDSQRKGANLSFSGKPLPIYGNAVTFDDGASVLTEDGSGMPALCLRQFGEDLFACIGYDLFQEIETLLTTGQPFENAAVPALEVHIQLLRDLITSSGIPLLEIPPVPDGYSFIACLTHDLDHAAIRRHKFDATIWGFLYRAIAGSAINVARRRLPLGKLFTNWAAAAKLPLIYLGLAQDIWYEFDRYIELEDGRPSTFFVIPFENRPGRSSTGEAPRYRETKYDVSHIAAKLPRLIAAGCEIGLHGIDAWLDSTNGREEARRISEISATPVFGVRMHWLYSDGRSAGALEEAGFSYDSTVGYNDTVGYRAGTGQAFKPLSATHLLELPMQIMDTALFYPTYLNLTEREARERLSPVFDDAVRYGGALTVNWHDRSIAPERLWGDFYVGLLNELTARGAWFSTAEQAVSWFRRRRSSVFERVDCEDKRLRVSVVDGHSGDDCPGLRLRFHRPRTLSELGQTDTDFRRSYTDTAFKGTIDFRFPN